MATNFQDILKSSFLDNASSISHLVMALALLLSFAVGLLIFFIYIKSYTGLMYSASFDVTLIALAMITLAVTSNIVLSLGMVGALSIVRFRTAITDPSDIAFLFWAIAVGIVLAAGLISLTVIDSLFIGLILLIFSQRKSFEKPYILVLHCTDSSTEMFAHAFIIEHVNKLSPKSKGVAPDALNWTMKCT